MTCVQNVYAQEYNRQYSKYQRISRYEADKYRVKETNTELTTKNRKGYYIGLDLLHNDNDYIGALRMHDSIGVVDNPYVKDKLYGLKILAGYRLNNIIGAEFFIQQSEEAEEYKREDLGSIVELVEQSSFSYRAIGLDFMGHFPIADYYELIASLGLGWYDFDVSSNVMYRNITTDVQFNFPAEIIGKTTAIGLRAGIGSQFYIKNNLSAVFMGRYIKMTNDDVVKSMIELSLGLRYNFY